MTPADKPRFAACIAARVAAELEAVLEPACLRILVVGSLRRRRPAVGDLELLYIPRLEARPDPGDLFGRPVWVNQADEVIARLEAAGTLERRRNVKGSEMFGEKNKLMRHRETGLPVDLFTATADNWANYLVCRTGPAESNTRIAMAAQARGWEWNPYGPGFSRGMEVVAMPTEQRVFEFVGLPYREPSERV